MCTLSSGLRQGLLALVLVSLVLSLNATTLFGQVQPRVVEAVDNARRVTLTGNVHPLARPEFDRGAVDDSLPMNRILLLLKRSDAQESALQHFLEQQQDKSSANYHAWLTPQQFGAQYGPADADIQAVTQWLVSQGFRVEKVYSGKTVIEFSGAAGQVRTTFEAPIRNYQVNGKAYVANANDPQIPVALAPVVSGIVSLNNFPRQSHARIVGQAGKIPGKPGIQPEFTFSTPVAGNFYAMAPGDFATIYNSKGLISAGNDGTGETIAIVGETNIAVSDVQSFHTMFGLPANFTSSNVILNGEDPGITSTGEESEADLDTQLAGGAAPGATVDLVVSASTPASAGIDLSALYIIEHNLAGVMGESYGSCESFLGTAGNAFYNSLWEQAAAQGITVVVSTGDNGSAGCDDFNTATTASNGLAVSGLASTPYNVALGGTDFDQVNNWSTFWSTTNTTTGTDTIGTSALSYIPEIPWNENCAQFGLTGCGANAPNGSVNIVAASGGFSTQYGKPSWQIGVAGMPNDSHRDLPDVSLFASPGFDGSGYIVCQADANNGAPCNLNTTNGPNFLIVGGTSAAVPTFAGVMALVNQYSAAHGGTNRQGNPNYVLYALAKKAGASCTSSTTEAAGCIFNDVTHGNTYVATKYGASIGTISVPCSGGSPNCSVTVAGQTGVLVETTSPSTEAYTVTPGYDLATGLGSVNIANLATNWVNANTVATTTTLTMTVPAGTTHGTSENVPVTITVTPKSGTATGIVSLTAKFSDGTTQGLDQFTLSNGTVSSVTNSLPGGTNYLVYAHYAGDGTNAPSDSAAVTVSVGQESSQTFIVVPTFDSNGNQLSGNATSVTYGSNYAIRMYVANAKATASTTGPPIGTCDQVNLLTCPTGTVTLTDNGAPLGTGGGGAGVFNLNNGGYTRYLTPNLPTGTHNLVASYSGDNSYKNSTSTAAILMVTSATMKLSLTLPASIVMGTPFFATITGTTSAVGTAPMGTLSLYDGGTLLVSLTGAGLGGYGGTGVGSGPTATAGFGVETPITLSTFGSHSLTATYTGDPNYSAVPTAPQVVHVVYPTIMSLQSNATTVNYGTSVMLTAILTTSQTSPQVTGQLTFSSLSGQSVITAGPTTLTANNGLQATATAVLQSSDIFTASYPGDTGYAAASATSPNITVTAPDFNLSTSQPGLTIIAGQPATLTLTITPNAPLGGSVQLQVTPPNPAITCSVSPPQLQLSGTSSATATLTCNVPAPSSSTSTTQTPQTLPAEWPKLGPSRICWKLSGLLAALAIVFWLLPVRFRMQRLGYSCLLLGLISFALGCGGSGGGGGGGSSGGGGATPTNTTLTVANTKVQPGSNLIATVQVNGNSPAGNASLGVVGESYSVNTKSLINGQAQFSYYLGAPGGYLMTAQYSGDPRNLPSQVQTPLAVVQTGPAGNVTVTAAIGPTRKQANVTVAVQ